MSATYYGPTTAHCYNDCRQEGCPKHLIRLVEKHGGIWVEEYRNDQWEKVHDYGDYSWFVTGSQMIDRGTYSSLQTVEGHRAILEQVLRDTYAALLKDGYAPSNAMMTEIYAVLNNH